MGIHEGLNLNQGIYPNPPEVHPNALMVINLRLMEVRLVYIEICLIALLLYLGCRVIIVYIFFLIAWASVYDALTM